MRFRYREYTDGRDPLAEPDPPPDEAVAAAEELLTLVTGAPADSEPARAARKALERALSRYGDGDRAAMAEVDADELVRLLGGEGREVLARLEEADHGLSPRELRRLGEVALRDVESARGRRGGSRPNREGRAQRGGEPTGGHLPRQTGDDRPLDPVATMRTAAQRRAAPGQRHRPLHPEDLRVTETEPAEAAAVSLLVDLSHSMAARSLHEAAVRTALALHTLVRTRHPEDRAQVVGFGTSAREMDPAALVAHKWRRIPGTNLHHALRLARAHLHRHPELRRRILVVTDGEPTAHRGEDGGARFAWPATPRTVEVTVAELDAALRDGAEVTFFLLADDPGLLDFQRLVERRRGVRVVHADAEALGPLVVDRYLSRW